MALKVPSEISEDNNIESGNGKVGEDGKTKADSSNTAKDKPKERRDRNRPPSKIVVRRLPPTMTEEVFRDQVSPIPEHDYLCFVRADLSLGPGAFSRAYINFLHQSDIITFKDQFDGYIFVDMLGNEYSAVVEFAPFQRLPKKSVIRRKDAICGTIEEDPAYISFLQILEEEMKDKENDHTFDYSYQLPEKESKKVTTTPLLEFLKLRRAERQRSRDERREERRKKERDREAERRKMREEERRKKKPEKEPAVAKQVLHNPAKDQGAGKTSRFKDVKPPGDRKRDEEMPPFKDKKYPESRGNMREKPGFKATLNSRQKPADIRPVREDRRPADDGRKKPASKPIDESRRAANSAKSSKYVEKDTRFKDREQRKPARDADVKKIEAGQEKRSEAVEQLSAAASKKRLGDGGRRFSFEGNRPARDSPDIKPFRKSAESLQDLQIPAERLTGKDYLANLMTAQPKQTHNNVHAKEKVEKVRRSSLESGGMDGDGVKAASSGARGPMRRNLSLELENDETDAEKAERRRSERRIRNKDRPSLEIYRPGMGRFSKQRIDREKD